MSDTFNCGFARIAVKESFHKTRSADVETDPEQRWRNYLAMFDDEGRQIFAVERFTYIKRSRTIYCAFRKMNSKCRSQYQETFSAENPLHSHRKRSIHCQIVKVAGSTFLIPTVSFAKEVP